MRRAQVAHWPVTARCRVGLRSFFRALGSRAGILKQGAAMNDDDDPEVIWRIAVSILVGGLVACLLLGLVLGVLVG